MDKVSFHNIINCSNCDMTNNLWPLLPVFILFSLRIIKCQTFWWRHDWKSAFLGNVYLLNFLHIFNNSLSLVLNVYVVFPRDINPIYCMGKKGRGVLWRREASWIPTLHFSTIILCNYGMENSMEFCSVF